ncbi:beta-lactamase family protein [Pseudomaricurvus alkylphenolicus]|uniref:serine hydrolase domain-containing protein n=1 Tax=Pseudomaricurvus alkylphenolicus TaxID=1306991 RepID=UPI0014242BE4|nr:serine hydrolase domain-containing protein [Pseudomaricurvus alkylphenolicus]NIB45205.1 beta-lactamase family protein [Pseudomaricurvus alkylphenolicus]
MDKQIFKKSNTHLIALLAGMLALPLVAAEIPTTSIVHESANQRDKALIRGLNAYLPEYLQEIDVPGLNIALARHGEVILEGAYGYADAASKNPVTPDTVFRSGSMGKTYTGVAIMQLVERGVISLDDPINKYLPFEVQNPLGGGEITVFHLMVHTSGLGGDAAGSIFGNTRPLDEVLRDKFSKSKQAMVGGIPTWTKKVGEERQYSNIGIATLGLIVERANPDKLSFSEFAEKNIMEPLGMSSTQRAGPLPLNSSSPFYKWIHAKV